jgi:hypothetical protein
MLIDRGHGGWFIATASVGVLGAFGFWWAGSRLPGGLTGASVAGMWFGIAGFGLMIFAALLSLLRLFPDRTLPVWNRAFLLALTELAGVTSLAIAAAWAAVFGRWFNLFFGFAAAVLASLAVARLLNFGSRSTWMKGHIWLGVLSAWFIALHSNFRLGGPLEQALWGLLALTLLTGAYGLVLQQFVPRLLTARYSEEVPVGQMAHVCRLLRQKADETIEKLRPHGPPAEGVAVGARGELWSIYERSRLDFFAVPYRRRSTLASPRAVGALLMAVRNQSWDDTEREALKELGEILDSRRRLGEQKRWHRHLHSWLLIHIPLSVALLALGAVHAVVSLWY